MQSQTGSQAIAQTKQLLTSYLFTAFLLAFSPTLSIGEFT
jgi:hypothetical protein